MLNLLEWIVLTPAVLGSLSRRPLWPPSLQATPSTGNNSDGLSQQLDRAEDRGDHHDHRAGDAHCQNVIWHRVSELAFTAVLPVELALERHPRRRASRTTSRR